MPTPDPGAGATARSGEPSERGAALLPLLALWLLVAVVFGPALGHGYVNWDDGQHVYANPVVREPWTQSWFARLTTPSVGYPTPLPTLVHGAAWAVGAGAAWVLHACSLLLHAVISTLLWRALVERGVSRAAALGGTLIFAIHPIVVEPVVWVTGLKDLGVGLGAVWLLSRSPLRRPHAMERPEDDLAGSSAGLRSAVRHRAALDLGAWLVAAASKPTAALLGIAVAVRALVQTRRDRSRPGEAIRFQLVTELATAGLTVALGMALLAFTRANQPDNIRTTLDIPWSISRPLAALGIAAEHVLAPIALSPVTPAGSANELHLVLGAGVSIGMISAWVHFARRADERASWLAIAMLAWLPVANIVPLVRFTADSYLYVPWLVVCATVTLSIHEFSRSRSGQELAEGTWRLIRVGLVAWLVGLTAASMLQVRVWRDDVTLWTAAVNAHPEEGELVVRLGDALGRAGDVPGELALYLEHESALSRHGVVPPAWIVFLQTRGDEAALTRWFELGLASNATQAESFFVYYAAHVVRGAIDPAKVNRSALARGLPMLAAAPEDYGLSGPHHAAALMRWQAAVTPASAP